ncbi:hypothetical protein [Thiorhodococcus mannitoliphagus]|nr:hypothetical protein [Thiorhodococcus mannitoliphagus]
MQRGHNRQVLFAEEADYLCCLETLETFKKIYDMNAYGFRLMTNHAV